MASDLYHHLPERLRNLLHSNDPIQQAHAELLNEYVTQREHALTQQRLEQEAIAQQLESLLAKQRQLKDSISRDEKDIMACKRRLSLSISAIPTEILQIIFTYSIPTALSVCTRHASTYHNQPPFTLVQVSRRWRHVALDLHSLWTSFSLRSFDSSKIRVPNFPAFQDMVKTFYKRGGGGREPEGDLFPKFTLDFYLESENLSKYFTNLHNPASAVFNEDIKIKHLSLSSICVTELLHALGRPGGADPEWWTSNTLQNVESLVLNAEVSGQSPQMRVDVFSQKRLKALKRLTLHTGRYLSETIWDTYYLPWKNLTHVAITSWMQHGEWTEFFPKLTGLQYGVFYIQNGDSAAEDNAAPVTTTASSSLGMTHHFQHLVDLTLIFANKDKTTMSFEPYKFPSIEHFRLGAYHQSSTFRAFDMLNIVQVQGTSGAFSSLTSLSLCHLSWEAPVQHIADILLLTVNLRTLTLGISTNYDQLLEQFQIDWNGFALLPNLESFTIDCVPSSYRYTLGYNSGASSDGGEGPANPSTGTFLGAPLLLILTAEGFTNMVKDRWKPLETISQLKDVSLFLSKGHERLLATIEGSLREEAREGLKVTVGTAGKPQWVDPLERKVTHWHEGLVLPDESDCATCLTNRALREKDGDAGRMLGDGPSSVD